MRRRSAILTLVSFAFAPGLAVGQDLFSGSASVEARGFWDEGLHPEQQRGSVSFALEPELYWASGGGAHAFTLAPFMRLDSGDSERTHVDIREAYWRTYGGSWELEAGILRAFWGVTESQHLVDVVNQTDWVENPDGEDKLGEVAIHGTWLADWGTVDVYLMPVFRERTFPGPEGRFRLPLLIDEDATAVEETLGVAARWFHFLGPLDLGISTFYGTSRDPRFTIVGPPTEPTGVAPLYEEVHQVGVDAQLVEGGWLWKLEAITRSGQGDRFYALTGGFEYTLGNIASSGVDLGLLAEYSYDSRAADLSTPPFAISTFQDDIFVGGRLALNDVQSTAVLFGAVTDMEYRSVSWLVEANRRVGDSFTADFEVRATANLDPMDPLYLFREDSFAQLGVSFYY